MVTSFTNSYVARNTSVVIFIACEHIVRGGRQLKPSSVSMVHQPISTLIISRCDASDPSSISCTGEKHPQVLRSHIIININLLNTSSHSIGNTKTQLWTGIGILDMCRYIPLFFGFILLLWLQRIFQPEPITYLKFELKLLPVILFSLYVNTNMITVIKLML